MEKKISRVTIREPLPFNEVSRMASSREVVVKEGLRRAIMRLAFVLTIGANSVIANAQQPTKAATDAKNTEILRAIDQLTEQNANLAQQNLELVKQNQELMELNRDLVQKINSFRPTETLFQIETASTAKQSATQSTGQRSGGNQGNDDKTKLPEASEGNPAIFGEFNPGRGFTVAQGKYGKLNLSGYMAVRYLNQLPASQSGTDHLGRPLVITPRQDFQFHRVMLFSQGWLFSPKFNYQTFVWTVQDTNQVAVGGALTYNFGKYMTLGAGWNAYPGTQSLQGSHPYWESYDRVMADEFFRPFFSQGVFGQGNLLPSLEYRWLIGNNNSNLDIPATKLDRELSGGFAITWMPTTHEFGPRGAFGDYENHQKVATRFNLAYTYSPEERQAPIGSPSSNTTVRLSDSLNVFDTGALANGVTVEKAHYKMVSAAAGVKYRGFWLQGEGYGRRLDHFVADGKLPLGVVRDFGFYAQMADFITKKVELYGATSYVFGQFGQPKEFIVGGNYYPWDTRNIRMNVQLINVDHSPVSSTFGFYVGGLTGQVFTIGVSALY